MESKTLTKFHLTKHSNMFVIGQPLWLVFKSGNHAALVIGRHKGNGKYIKGWVRWNDTCIPKFEECEVDEHFYNFVNKQ
jgi:hypothetical protein